MSAKAPVVLTPEQITEIEALEPDVSWLPADLHDRWRHAVAAQLPGTQIDALRACVAGDPQTTVARAHGMTRHDLRYLLERFSLQHHARAMASKRLLDNHREIALEGTEQILTTLDKPGGKVDKGLAIVAAISTDKVAMKEGWQRGDLGDGNLGDKLAEIADKIVRGGGRLDLTIEGPGGKAKIEAGE